MSKRTGSSRIPVFGPRIPVPEQIAPTNTNDPREITAKDIGKKVRVAGKEGLLKFIGNVHFATGVWCGVELSSAVGKNDGFVCGVRYFACPESRGLMAPHSKVSLIDEIAEDAASGPYSMIFDVNDQLVSSESVPPPNLDDKTFTGVDRRTRKLIRSETFDKPDRNEAHVQHGRQCVKATAPKQAAAANQKESYRNTEITCDATITIPQSNCDDFVLNDSDGPTNKTIINISITNRPRIVNISHSGQVALNDTEDSFSNQQIRRKNPPKDTDFSSASEGRRKTYNITPNKTYSTLQVDKSILNATQNLDATRRRSYTCPDQPNELISNTTQTLEGSETSKGDKRRTFTVHRENTDSTVNATQNLERSSKQGTLDKTALNATVNLVSVKSPNRTYTGGNWTFDVRSDKEPDLNATITSKSIKAPSELNLRNAGYNETDILKKINETLDRPRSYPTSEEYFSPITSAYNKFAHSTPVRKEDVEGSPKRFPKAPLSQYGQELEEESKRDSLDCEESLGILTPDQMVDMSCFAESRSPSSENIRSLPNDLNVVLKYQKCEGDLVSPNVADSSAKDYSLGIIDEHILSTFTVNLSDTTVNMELPLDTENKKDFALTRIEQTPSPEDLPLDPTPIADSDPKTEPSQSKTTSNFITSITSITSIDTGYQGDGEMSRPASRGADNSPLTRRPLPRPQPRRPDPMTDSDFYTESDADNHEEHPLRGDRKAQVIDGTLYGVDPQAAADIYVNNRENMDSSGIFTDLESNTKAEELSAADNDNNQNVTADVSPSDSSTKTISDNSQDNVMLISKTPTANQTQDARNVSDSAPKENTPKRNTPSPSTVTSSPTSIRSPRHAKDNNAKIYKMPKRNVASKVKAMMEPNETQKIEKRSPPKKPVGRWDAVMNKISKGQDNSKTNLKEIKPKVFTRTVISNNVERNEPKKIQPTNSQKSPNNKLRRVRTRATTNTTPTKKATNIESSIHSSLSDLSGASPAKKIGSAKKQREVVRVTQVLTAGKLSPKSNNHTTNEAAKKNTTISNNDVKNTNKRNLFANKEKKKEVTIKGKSRTFVKTKCSRTTAKGGRVSPGTRPPQQQRVSVKAAPKTAEALAVLVQHLVFNLEAFRVPSLKREVDKIRLNAEEARLSCLQLEEQLADERLKSKADIETERSRCRQDIANLIEQHRNNILQLKNKHAESEQRIQTEAENVRNNLNKLQEEQLQSFKIEFDKLQKSHAESLDILREENDAIREEIDEKNAVIEKLKHYKFESEKLKRDYEAKETSYKEQLQAANEEIARLRDDNLNYCRSTGNSSMQEVQSLRVVLELKQSEVAELRKALAEASQKADMLPMIEEKVCCLTARCEDLLSQLERKNSFEMSIVQEKKKLEESYKEEINQRKRLILHNEELQWKLQQNKEVVTRVLEQAEEGAFNRSMLSASFSERHTSTRHNLERTHSFRERSSSIKSNNSADVSYPNRKLKNSYELELDDYSPPSSPKIKGVVEKSDSVSYVLEMDESPEVVASRIVRRSFRNSTPPKNTPTKSPCNKRPRMKNPLSLSASASAIIPNTKTDHLRSRSISVRNGGEYETGSNHSDDVFSWNTHVSSTPIIRKEMNQSNESYRCGDSNCKLEDNIDFYEEHDVDIKLPTLPSEIGRNNELESLPVPRHLAGEAMISESNSDDESTTSSSSGQL